MTEQLSGVGRRAVPAQAVAPSLALLLKQGETRIRLGLQPLLDEVGLALEHWQIMSVLHHAPGLRMTALAEAAVVPAATLTRHVDKLVELGLVVRRVDPSDKRRVAAALSPRGQELATRISAGEADLERRLTDGLGAERFESLKHDLALLGHLLD
ncbi:MarR family transcriptional regulator [Nocardioides sp.]|jgi:DNA-binding MarR family transcriptional regulator|uniref:MarR family winged helix-turn-helix transcriptional regulator n=1 Tax=Nocardioides sp. TaxID=35761 RepID=UPI002625E25F|nr:MarR family transcriptional regulator [Nocardioides sp.]